MIAHPQATPDSGPHRYVLRVYYEDTDAGGVVYHAGYLRFAERARTEAMREAGIPHAELVATCNLMFVVRRVKLDYLRPARLDQSVTVLTEPMAVGGASVVLRQGFVGPGGARLAELEILLACVGVADGRPARIPKRWRDAFRAMLEPAG